MGTTPIRIPKDMGIVWETYHKGVPFLGVPENATEGMQLYKMKCLSRITNKNHIHIYIYVLYYILYIIFQYIFKLAAHCMYTRVASV